MLTFLHAVVVAAVAVVAAAYAGVVAAVYGENWMVLVHQVIKLFDCRFRIFFADCKKGNFIFLRKKISKNVKVGKMNEEHKKCFQTRKPKNKNDDK